MLALGLWFLCTKRTGGETLGERAQQMPLPQGFISCFPLSLSVPSLPEVMTKTYHYTLILLSHPTTQRRGWSSPCSSHFVVQRCTF